MVSDNEIIQRLVANEGFRTSPYRCSEGKLTIGVGRCLDTNPLTKEELAYIGHDCRTKPITKDQAFYLLRHDIQTVKEQMYRNFPWVKNLNDDRQYSLLDMIFQMGVARVKGFKKTLLFLSTGNYTQAGAELLDSNYARQTPARARRNSFCFKFGIYKYLKTE